MTNEWIYEAIFWIGCLITIFMAASMLAYRHVMNRAPKKINQALNALQRIAIFDSNNSDLERMFIQQEGRADTKRLIFDEITYWKGALLEPFLILLRNKFESVEGFKSFTNADYNETVYIIRNGEDGVGYLRVMWQMKDAFYDDDTLKPTYQADSLDINSYLYENNKLPVIGSLELIVPIQNNDNKIFEIKDIIEECRVENITHLYRECTEHTSVMNRLVITRQGITLSEFRIESADTFISPKEADLMYSDVNLEYAGKTYSRKPSQMMKVLLQAANEGTNIQIFGQYGTGKTRIGHSIAARLSQDSNKTIIYISPTVLRQLDDLKAQSDLTALFRGYIDREPNHRFYLFIDEAEAALRADNGFHTAENSFLLQFMDGVEKNLYNISLIMTFNAKPADLNQALFREGRKGVMVHMSPITKERAGQLAEYLKTKYPDRIFYPAQLAKHLEEDSTTPNGTIYAPVGFTTIADVVNCFKTKQMDQVFYMLEEQEKGNNPDIPEREVATLKPQSPFPLTKPSSRPKAVTGKPIMELIDATKIGASKSHSNNSRGNPKKRGNR